MESSEKVEVIDKTQNNLRYWKDRYKRLGGEKTVGALSWDEPQYQQEIAGLTKVVTPLLDYKEYKDALDFGCGIGRWKPLIESLGATWYGCDIVEQHPQSQLIRDGQMPYDFQFDLIWCCTVLQHVTNDSQLESYMDKFRELIKGDGLIVLIENTSTNEDKDYIRYREPGEYAEFLHGAGFSTQSPIEHKFGTEEHSIIIGR